MKYINPLLKMEEKKLTTIEHILIGLRKEQEKLGKLPIFIINREVTEKKYDELSLKILKLEKIRYLQCVNK